MQDHRKLGRDVGLFDSDPLIGAGLPYWLPAGATIRHAIEEYIREAERLAGYQHVYSPVLAKRELFERSGHWAHYREDMFPPMAMGDDELVLRPSLCPDHALIYRPGTAPTGSCRCGLRNWVRCSVRRPPVCSAA